MLGRSFWDGTREQTASSFDWARGFTFQTFRTQFAILPFGPKFGVKVRVSTLCSKGINICGL